MYLKNSARLGQNEGTSFLGSLGTQQGSETGKNKKKIFFSRFFGDFCVFSDFRPYSNKAVIQVPPYFMEVGPFCMGIGFGPVGPQLMGKSKNQKIIF